MVLNEPHEVFKYLALGAGDQILTNGVSPCVDDVAPMQSRTFGIDPPSRFTDGYLFCLSLIEAAIELRLDYQSQAIFVSHHTVEDRAPVRGSGVVVGWKISAKRDGYCLE